MLVFGVERCRCEKSKVETRTKDVGPFVVDFEGMISGATFYGGCMCLRRTCRAQGKRREMRDRERCRDLIDLVVFHLTSLLAHNTGGGGLRRQ